MDVIPNPVVPASPLMLADRLLTLAQDVERAGFPDAAKHLVTLVYDVLDGPARRH